MEKALMVRHYAIDKVGPTRTIEIVSGIDNAISVVDGSGFHITPTGSWE